MDLKPGDRLKFIGCEIIFREACKLASASPFRVDVEFLPKGLHDLATGGMIERLQQAVDALEPPAGQAAAHKAILLGYARCNNGVVGLRARSVPLVIPKAHDCITFYFGSRKAYKEYFDAYPGTYFHTTGWLERNDPRVPGQQGVMDQLGLSDTYEQLVAKYGKDNADYIRETLGDTRRNYSRLCYIEMGVADERDFIQRSRTEAADRGWQFERRKGDWSLLEKLFAGRWDDDFVIVPPGAAITPRNDDEVLGSG
jgi:hypothetical protein